MTPSATRRTARFALPLVGMLALAACSSGGNPTTQASASAECATPDADNNITISAKDLAFSTGCIEAPADTGFTITFENQEAAPHNIAIYADDSKSQELFKGDVITETSTTYQVPPLPAGDHYFECQVHPDMKGSVTVS